MNDKWFMSSDGTGDLSLTLKGLLLAVIPLTVNGLQHFGVKVTENDVVNIVNAALAAVSAVVIVIGLVRKAFNRVA